MRREKESGIYCIENTVNNKKYIGQSKKIKYRCGQHIRELENNYHYNEYLQRSWNKYGKDNFKFYVLEYCDVDSLDEKEKYYILLYNTIDRDNGYNLTSGGQYSNSKSEDTVEKLKKSIKQSYENDPSLIQKRKEDAVEYWSNSDNLQYHSGERNGMYGKHHTEEAKEKMRQGRKKRKSNNSKPRKVLCHELNKVFNSASGAAKELNLFGSNILNVCCGKRKTCGGYHWSFVE